MPSSCWGGGVSERCVQSPGVFVFRSHLFRMPGKTILGVVPEKLFTTCEKNTTLLRHKSPSYNMYHEFLSSIFYFFLFLFLLCCFSLSFSFQVRRGVVPPCPPEYTRKVYGSGPRFMNQDDETDSEPELVIPSRGNRDKSPEVCACVLLVCIDRAN